MSQPVIKLSTLNPQLGPQEYVKQLNFLLSEHAHVRVQTLNTPGEIATMYIFFTTKFNLSSVILNPFP